LWLKELTSNAVIVAQQAREEQARRANGIATTPVSNPTTTTTNNNKKEVSRGELPIDQVLQYINGESTTSRKGKKKTQQKKK
jgi:protein TIF31